MSALNLAPIPFSERVARAGLYHLRTILRVQEGPSGWFDAATLAVQVGAIGILLRMGQLSVPPYARFMAVAVLILAALPLPTLFGVGYIADRTPLFAALALIGVLCVRPGEWTGAGRLLGGILIAVAVIRVAAISVHWHSYAQQYDGFRSVAAHIRPQSLTTTITAGAGKHETHIPRCQMYGPLLIAELGHAGPLFADEKQQPLRLIGALKGSGSIGSAAPPGYRDQVLGPLSAGYDDVLVCNAQLLADPVPDGVRVVASTGQFMLLRLQQPRLQLARDR